MTHRLLIVEDELIERMVLKKTLLKKFEGQCEIYEAQNGREAVEVFQREKIEIVILDIGMPGMNGIQAAEIIRKESPDCCIIFLTAYDRFEYARKAVSVRAMEYLLKPYSNKEIICVMEEALRSRERAVGEGSQPVSEVNAEAEILAEEPDGINYSRIGVLASMIEEYIRANYMYDISMHDAARAINYSDPYFCKIFKQQYGQNFTSYLADYRIGEAKKLLCQPNVNVKEVGIRVGYPDNNYFTKVFKRMTGENPSEYRQNILKKL